MKKLLIALIFIALSMNVWSWEASPSKCEFGNDLDRDGQINAIPDPWNLPEITWEELEGEKYTILVVHEDFIIVEKDGILYILRK